MVAEAEAEEEAEEEDEKLKRAGNECVALERDNKFGRTNEKRVRQVPTSGVWAA